VNAGSESALLHWYKQVDVIVDLLPRDSGPHVNEAALKAKVSVVNTNYRYHPEALE
jgi:saccharopine dehydrogenase-like NADP-dependent oxidoreductase